MNGIDISIMDFITVKTVGWPALYTLPYTYGLTDPHLNWNLLERSINKTSYESLELLSQISFAMYHTCLQ
jgi:hypothetical protein